MRRSAFSDAGLVVLFYFGYAALHAAAATTLLHEFAGGANDGRTPIAPLTVSGSTLFGTTHSGGDPCPNSSAGCGTVFSMNTDGSGFALLHEFVGGGNDGRNPAAGLTQSGSTLYGTTTNGGDNDHGTIFAMSTDGSGFTLLHEFAGGANDGEIPQAGLILSGSTLYGTTLFGGGEGTVFSINTDGSDFTLLHSFDPANDGRRLKANLTLSGSTLFGTTILGGANDLGTIFSINTDGSGYTPLHEFAGGANDGEGPLAGLILSGSTLYGTTQGGGDHSRGTIFSINTNGSGFTLLHEFAGGADDGRGPEAELTLSGSTLYGTTKKGGDLACDTTEPEGCGTIFSINTDGSGFTLLHEFAGGADDGAVPWARLTLSGSTLYGTTERGGEDGLGTVFSIEIAEPGLPGDYNNNGTVDAADYILWRKNGGGPDDYETWHAHFGQSAGVIQGDFNNDGSVDAADYVVWRKNDGSEAGYNTWRTNFGRTAGSGSAGISLSQAAVPEPGSAILLLLLMMMSLLVCQRRLFNLSAGSAAIAARV